MRSDGGLGVERLVAALDGLAAERPCCAAGHGAARPHRAAGRRPGPDRRRARPHRPPCRADRGAEARRAAVDGLLAARAHPAVHVRRSRAGPGRAGAGALARPGRRPTPPEPSPPSSRRDRPIAADRALALAADQGIDLAAIDRALTDFATTHSPADTERLVQAYLDRLDADGPEPDPTEGRTLHRGHPPRRAGHRPLRPRPGRRGEGPHRPGVLHHRRAHRRRHPQPRPAARRRASCSGPTPPWPPAPRPAGAGSARTSAIKVDLEDLVDPARAPGTAEAGFGAVLSAARARWAACDADLTRIVLDPDGLPLDVGRTHASRPRLAPQSRRTPRRRLRVRRLRRPHLVVRGPPPDLLGPRRRDLAWRTPGLLCERHHTRARAASAGGHADVHRTRRVTDQPPERQRRRMARDGFAPVYSRSHARRS